jgi:hypothetical protein
MCVATITSLATLEIFTKGSTIFQPGKELAVLRLAVQKIAAFTLDHLVEILRATKMSHHRLLYWTSTGKLNLDSVVPYLFKGALISRGLA